MPHPKSPTAARTSRRRGLVLGAALVAAALVAGLVPWPFAAARDLAPPLVVTPAPSPAALGEVVASQLPGPEPAAAPMPAERQPAPIERTAAPATLAPQGLHGLVLGSRNEPLPGVAVHLVESGTEQPLLLPAMLQRGQLMAPIASATSAADGSFALGLPVAQDRSYDLFVVSRQHTIAHRSGLRVLPAQWHDLGAIVLSEGTTVRGRVTVAGRSDMPVPQAVVTVETGTGFADVAQKALPDGDVGASAAVDANGHYELHHAPTRGTVRVSAEAPGFARVTRPLVELDGSGAMTLDFELPPGHTITGRVVDSRGQGIAGARLEAWPASPSALPLFANGDDDGHFTVHGLPPGPHRLRIGAQGFASTVLRTVDTDRAPLLVTLAELHSVTVHVKSPSGAPVRNFQLGLRAYVAGLAFLGNVVDVPDRRVELGVGEHAALVQGVPAGTFVCEVEAEGFAKTFSAPFVCADTGAPTAVEVVLVHGASLRGSVFDEAGRPLAGAEVATKAAGIDLDHPLARAFAGNLPERISPRRTTTAADGSFELRHLAHGDYQLLVEHPSACRARIDRLDLGTDGERQLPPIRLVRGAEVLGRATVGGRVAGQMKVVLRSAPGTPPEQTLRCETITDPAGSFRLPQRVPPGSYELRAAVVGSDGDGARFAQLLQLQRSSITVSVLPGQEVVERDLDLPPGP